MKTLAFIIATTVFEAVGDALMRITLHHRVTSIRAFLFALATVLLAMYGASLNLAPVEFAEATGIYMASLPFFASSGNRWPSHDEHRTVPPRSIRSARESRLESGPPLEFQHLKSSESGFLCMRLEEIAEDLPEVMRGSGLPLQVLRAGSEGLAKCNKTSFENLHPS